MKTDNPYIKQFPDLMKGKKLLYVHGFGSSGQSGTVNRMRQVMPSASIIAPDLPLNPQDAMDLLHKTCDIEHPDLIIGTSMGGMYAEMLYGYDRILVNPAFEMGDTMVSHGLVGTQQFSNPRQDGIQDFIVTKALVKEYKEITQKCFNGVTDEEKELRVVGLFGDKDSLVDTYNLFKQHYRHAIHFHGEHRMDDKSFMHSVVPAIRWFDDRQEQRERPIIYIDIATLRDSYGNALSSCQKAYRWLTEHYHVYITAPVSMETDESMQQTTMWAMDYIGVDAYKHLVFTDTFELLYGDYLIAKNRVGGISFMGTHIEFGSDTFKTWEDTLGYFERLGGQ